MFYKKKEYKIRVKRKCWRNTVDRVVQRHGWQQTELRLVGLWEQGRKWTVYKITGIAATKTEDRRFHLPKVTEMTGKCHPLANRTFTWPFSSYFGALSHIFLLHSIISSIFLRKLAHSINYSHTRLLIHRSTSEGINSLCDYSVSKVIHPCNSSFNL